MKRLSISLVFIFLLLPISKVEYKKEIDTKDSIRVFSDIAFTLEIPSISLTKDIYLKNSKKNNLNGIYYLEASTDLEENPSHIFLASHSGNSRISYFKNLDKVKINDTIYLKKDKRYEYQVINIYKIDKTGIYTYREQDIKDLTLITCDKKENKQLILYAILKN